MRHGVNNFATEGAMLTRAPRATFRSRTIIARASMRGASSMLAPAIERCTRSMRFRAGVSMAPGTSDAHIARESRRGFTLIEVMATLLLVGIVLPAIMEGISLSNSAGRYAKTSLQATALAQTKLNEIVATTVASAQPTTGVYSGDFASVDPQYEGYKWSAEMIERTDIENELGITGVIEVTVRVSWQVRAENRTVSLSTLIYVSQQNTGQMTGQSGGASSGTQR